MIEEILDGMLSLGQAQSLIFDGLLVEATLAREMVEESKALSSEASLPTLLTGNFDSHSMPKPLYSFVWDWDWMLTSNIAGMN